ncbi:uncharacterized protein LOC131943507 [Physella acuta]|uniref:uncharacterized protein LOC131943507 n=1 Tax=Physella acuta TaxID=109671 RepID=UPI0027DDD66D|nr:uncharacterized protein LOC131943507 [Physella acuta]
MVLAEVTDADMRSHGGVLHIWVGANDEKTRGTFVWDHSQSPIDDRDLWDQGQPRPDRWAFETCAGINNNHKLAVYGCNSHECGSNEEFELGEICYRLYPTPRYWRDAKAECENNGLHFAKLTRDEDLVDLRSLINHQQVWVGAIEEENHRYHWVFDGQPLAMQVTDESQGDGCVMLLNLNSLQSKVCDTRFPYLCMKKPTVKTDTASTITITTPAPKVWFGQGDLFLCHCEAPHCGAGACQGDTAPCEQNWFGLRCQYRNLAGAAYVLDSSLPSLTDNDDSTCHQQDRERSVTVKFREEQFITWIRIVVKDKIDHYTVQAFSGLTPRACTNMSVLQPTPTTLDLACNLGTVYVTKVTVSWRVHHVICSLYISGGRNLALKSRVSHSPAANTTPSDAAVDGQLTQPCLVLNDSVTHQQLQLAFSTPKLITEIVIHTSTANTSYGTLNGFRLEVVGEGEVSLQNLTGVRADVTGRLRFKSIVRRPAMRVDVNLVSQPGHPMEVCELEVFGDCSSPVYGLYCDEICSMGCVDQLCHYNGQCYHCVEGRTGKHCVGGKGGN